MNRSYHLRLGTRGSLLAVAQSRLVAAALERRHPGLSVELIRMDTRGDRNQQTPLTDINDPNFFSDSLDAALLNHQVDAVVHSRKDLGEIRPDGLCIAAMPARANPRDVIVFRNTVIEHLRRGQRLRIGSSSTRRRVQVESFLREYLPAADQPVRLEFRPLRGAVDQRLHRINGDSEAADALDGVVLALAGLERLWADRDGRAAIAPVLAGKRWMVLPLSVCPAAPGQGALAIECRNDNQVVRELLAPLHDPATTAAVEAEYLAATRQPADQQDGFAATAIDTRNLGRVLFTRGLADAETSRLHWQRPPRPGAARPWCVPAESSVVPVPPDRLPGLPAGPVFVAHWRAAANGLLDSGRHRIWVSGTGSWRKLAAEGLWVEGCGDHLGFEEIRQTLGAAVLQLPALSAWTTLTRLGAEASWAGSGVGQVIGSYALAIDPGSPPPDLRHATHFFWSSSEQFRRFRKHLPAAVAHACGNGKTAAALRRAGLSPVIFPSRREWQAWLA